MPEPITPADLYGPSNPPTPEEVTVTPPIVPVEETPEIVVETPPPAPMIAPGKKPSVWLSVGSFIFFVCLFGIGIWLSGYVRQYFLPGIPTTNQTTIVPLLTPSPKSLDPFADWKSYQIKTVSYKLPPDVLAPICDTTTCMSMGTYLPGGTRFTVASRGVGELLSDFRGSAISDMGGVVFTTRMASVSGILATEFSGSFTGKTAGGYGFSQMRGFMIATGRATSVELNHFTPSGISSDFAADDLLFDQIVGTVQVATSQATPIQ